MNTAKPPFRERLLSEEVLAGTFVKTPSPIICEVLGLTGLDVVCLDSEHAPFGRVELDGCIAALRSAGMPGLVRVAANSPEYILQALDYGAAGVVVPHVTTPEQAESVVKSAHFGAGGRGYAGSTRAAGYTTRPMREHLEDGASATTVIIQVEDREAVDAIDELCSVDGVDCLFIGRVDLTVSLNADSPSAEVVLKALKKICRTGQEAGKSIGMFISAPEEARKWMDYGVNLFLSGSEHAFILRGANQVSDLVKS